MPKSELYWLEAELETPIANLLALPAFDALRGGSLSLEKWRRFGFEYLHYCEAFPRMLAAVASSVPDDETRMNLVENLWEEHGEGNLTLSHRVLLKKFLTAVGWNGQTPSPETLLPSTIRYVDAALEVCRSRHFLVGLGFLGPGAEMFTNKQYRIVLEGLEAIPALGLDDLTFWRVHTECDDDHYLEMARAISRWSDAKDYEGMVREGALMAINLESAFWEGIGRILLAPDLSAR